LETALGGVIRLHLPENSFTHYLVSKEVVLGEACIIEKCNEWISLAFIKLGIGRPEVVADRAFVENHALVCKTPN
jgi:hypothetical protein